MSLIDSINEAAEKRAPEVRERIHAKLIEFGTNPTNTLDLSIGQLAHADYWIEVYVQLSGQVAIDATKNHVRYGGRAETFELALADLNDVIRKSTR